MADRLPFFVQGYYLGLHNGWEELTGHNVIVGLLDGREDRRHEAGREGARRRDERPFPSYNTH